MTHPRKFCSKWLWFALCVILAGTVLFLFGFWCLLSTGTPTPPLALPFPPRLLTGLGVMLWCPVTLIPLTLILVASRFLVSRLSRLSAAAVAFVGVTGILVGAFWVPNPIVLWPLNVFGEHRLPELIDELFAFHIVPSPPLSYDSLGGMEALNRWQIIECGARFCILNLVWIACLVAIWTANNRLSVARSHPNG
jgi:hypothetical protein